MGVELPPVETFFDEAPCGLLLTASDGTIVQVNSTFCRWTGHEAEALLDKRTLQSMLSVGGRIFHQTHWAPLLQMQGSVAEVKLDFLHADGHRIPCVINARRRSWEGEPFNAVAVFVAQDRHKYELEVVRARAEAQARATFAEQMMGIVGHDLRNPLSTLGMIAQLIRRAPDFSDESRLQTADRLQRAVDAGNRLIADMLDFTAAKIGKGITVSPKALDLHALVAQAVSDQAASHPARRFEHVATGDPRCTVDPDRLVQLLGNLVANAVTYGSSREAIRIESSVDTGRASVSVRNGGTPIPQALMPRIFEPMTRGDNPDQGHRSVGLGLFIVSEIARAHGGSIEVSSTEEAGTKFTFAFPLPSA